MADLSFLLLVLALHRIDLVAHLLLDLLKLLLLPLGLESLFIQLRVPAYQIRPLVLRALLLQHQVVLVELELAQSLVERNTLQFKLSLLFLVLFAQLLQGRLLTRQVFQLELLLAQPVTILERAE